MGVADMYPTGPDFVHTVTEAIKLAFADREAFYGDPDFVDVPMATLLSAGYNEGRRRLIGDRASLDLRPGTIDGCDRTLDAAVGVAATGDPPELARMEGGGPSVLETGVTYAHPVNEESMYHA